MDTDEFRWDGSTEEIHFWHESKLVRVTREAIADCFHLKDEPGEVVALFKDEQSWLRSVVSKIVENDEECSEVLVTRAVLSKHMR